MRRGAVGSDVVGAQAEVDHRLPVCIEWALPERLPLLEVVGHTVDVVDQQVDAPLLVDRARDQRFNLRIFAVVTGDGDTVAAAL